MIRKTEGGPLFRLRNGYRLNPAAEGFRHVASAEKRESYGGAGFSGNMDSRFWKAEVEEEKLYKKRRIP